MNRLQAEIKYQLRYALPVWAIQVLTSFLPDNRLSIRFRGSLVSLFLPGRPPALLLGRDVTLLCINRLKISKNVYLAKGVWLNAIGDITLESEVVLGPYVVMSSNNHGFKDGSVSRGGAHPAPICIGFGSWLASHVVIGAGVTVGRGNLVAANSVVTASSVDNVVLGGVPARIIKDRVDNPSEVHSKHEAEK